MNTEEGVPALENLPQKGKNTRHLNPGVMKKDHKVELIPGTQGLLIFKKIVITLTKQKRKTI